VKEEKKILLIPGDGIGPEVIHQAKKIINIVDERHGLSISLEEAFLGGCAYEEFGDPLPQETIEKAKWSDAILLGAVGGPKWDKLSADKKPEKGLLGLRSEFDFFANLRPAILSKHLVKASSLKADLVSDLDLLIVRELTGGIYFGEPRGFVAYKKALNTMVYEEEEILRIGKVAFESAMKRSKRLCSVDKSNVLEVSALWREVITDLSKEYQEVELTHQLVDNTAMQLVRDPKQFDVIVTSNLFGDILSDIAAMLTGSIGMLPSASLNSFGKGLYEPVHGSAPDIANKGLANPIASILSVAMMMRHTFHQEQVAKEIEESVDKVLSEGYITSDLDVDGNTLNTEEMGNKIMEKLRK
tara:strand:- start:13515 stop:14585 length:1071 start_codon:yes stop_codon:yes gene_type:complete